MRNVVINYLVGAVLSTLLMLAMSQLFFGSTQVLSKSVREMPFGWVVVMVVVYSAGALAVHMVREFWNVWTKEKDKML